EPGPGRIINPRLKTAEVNAVVSEILISEKCAEQNSAEHDQTGNDHRGAWPAIYKKQDERQREIKLIFHRERPGVGECGAAMKGNVLDREKKFPERLCHIRILAP